MDLQILMDLWIYGFWHIFGFNYGFDDFGHLDAYILKDHLARQGIFSF